MGRSRRHKILAADQVQEMRSARERGMALGWMMVRFDEKKLAELAAELDKFVMVEGGRAVLGKSTWHSWPLGEGRWEPVQRR